MKRRHLFEWNDQPWLPAPLRVWLTQLLRYQYEKERIYAPAAGKLLELMLRTGEQRFIDFGAGTGGPWRGLLEQMQALTSTRLEVVLTDKFPQADADAAQRTGAAEGLLHFAVTAVDALAIPPSLHGIRTLFSTFHHLREDDALKFLQQAVDDRAPVAIFEFTERRLTRMAGMLFAPLYVWAVMPRIRPPSRWRLFWTYAVPLLPLLYLWDGLVSHWRSYTPEEMRLWTGRAQLQAYDWDAGQIKSHPSGVTITYLLGSNKSL